MSRQKVNQSELSRRVGRSKSHINRLCWGQLRLLDPWLASKVELVTDGEVPALAVYAFVAQCVGEAA